MKKCIESVFNRYLVKNVYLVKASIPKYVPISWDSGKYTSATSDISFITYRKGDKYYDFFSDLVLGDDPYYGSSDKTYTIHTTSQMVSLDKYVNMEGIIKLREKVFNNSAHKAQYMTYYLLLLKKYYHSIEYIDDGIAILSKEIVKNYAALLDEAEDLSFDEFLTKLQTKYYALTIAPKNGEYIFKKTQ